MKQLPEKFLNALKNLLSKDDEHSKRFIQKVEENPEKTAQRVYNDLGSKTQPIKLR